MSGVFKEISVEEFNKKEIIKFEVFYSLFSLFCMNNINISGSLMRWSTLSHHGSASQFSDEHGFTWVRTQDINSHIVYGARFLSDEEITAFLLKIPK